ncbi:rho GTPase-activating protein 20-like [Rattus norvegicus]|nr:rho GTPase-activating protein 20-like [Rattus norvegicus]XP_038956378.1 rho GTPase-activating protein 20-like [Rattus norvegicus]
METHGEKATLFHGVRGSLLLEGPVEFRRGWRKKKRHLFLLNDLLVVSNNIHKKKFKIKYIIPLSYLWICDYADLVGGDNRTASKSIFLCWPMENFVATFCTKEQKKWWWFFLQRYINEAKMNGESKSAALQMVTEDIRRCTSACA